MSSSSRQPTRAANAPRSAAALAGLARTVRYRLACELGIDGGVPEFIDLGPMQQGELLANALAAVDREQSTPRPAKRTTASHGARRSPG